MPEFLFQTSVRSHDVDIGQVNRNLKGGLLVNEQCVIDEVTHQPGISLLYNSRKSLSVCLSVISTSALFHDPTLQYRIKQSDLGDSH